MNKKSYVDYDGFYKKFNPYMEKGVLKEIYSDESISVMNMGEQFYGVFPRILTPDSKGGQYFGMTLSVDLVEYVIDNGLEGYYDVMNNFNKDMLAKSMIFMDDKMANILKSRMDMGIVNTNKNIIDKEFEEKLQQVTEYKEGRYK